MRIYYIWEQNACTDGMLILTSKYSAKLKQYYYFMPNFLKQYGIGDFSCLGQLVAITQYSILLVHPALTLAILVQRLFWSIQMSITEMIQPSAHARGLLQSFLSLCLLLSLLLHTSFIFKSRVPLGFLCCSQCICCVDFVENALFKSSGQIC